MTQTVQRRPDELQGGVLVASVPANHVYVHHLAAEDGGGVQRLPDPDPDDPRHSAEETWWPPVMLGPDWSPPPTSTSSTSSSASTPGPRASAGRGGGSPSTTKALRLHRARPAQPPPRGPQPARRAARRARPGGRCRGHAHHGAAAGDPSSGGGDGLSLPHPHVVDFATMERLGCSARRQPGGPRSGCTSRACGASMDPGDAAGALRFVSANPGAVLQVNGHRDLLEPGGASYSDELDGPAGRGAAGLVDLRVHDFMPDAELWPTWPRSTSPSCPTASAPTRAGWRRAVTSARPWWPPAAATTRDQGPVVELRQRGEHVRPGVPRAGARRGSRRPGLGRLTVESRREQRARSRASTPVCTTVS